MEGRVKGMRERIIILAHQTEAMARQKKLKPVDKYLKPAGRKAGDSDAVVGMFAEMAAKGKATVVRRPRRQGRRSGEDRGPHTVP